jgi:hypothetical protein
VKAAFCICELDVSGAAPSDQPCHARTRGDLDMVSTSPRDRTFCEFYCPCQRGSNENGDARWALLAKKTGLHEPDLITSTP